MNQNARPWYFWPLIAFVAGLLIGWLVIGWGLWPVTWTNAQVRDLRSDLRLDYVSMVAESYAQSRDLDQARVRLDGWSAEELAAMLTEAQPVLMARNAQAAQNVQELAVALGATAAAPAPGGQAQPQTQATATATEDNAGAASTLRQICTAGLFVLLAAGALVVLALLFRRWRATQSEAAVQPRPDYGELDASQAAEREKTRWPAREAYSETVVEDDRPNPSGFAGPPAPAYSAKDEDVYAPPERPANQLRPVGGAPVETAYSEPIVDRPPTPAPATPTSGLKRLMEHTAIYQMGEPDYDEAIDIADPADGFMGQFGLQLIEPFGRERDQAVALQVWLWDSSDPDTQAKVLMSEGAYRDTALRSQHAGEHEALSVRPGSEFELSSHDLLLKGRVEKVSYAEAEPPRGVFADLAVKLTVYRRE